MTDYIRRVFILSGLFATLIGCSSSQTRDVMDLPLIYSPGLAAESVSDNIVADTFEGDLTLQESIEIALRNNLNIRTVMEERAKAAGMLVEARSGRLPAIDLSLSYTRLDEVPSGSMGPTTIELGDENNWNAEISIEQLLYAGGQVSNSIAIAELSGDMAREQLKSARDGIIFLTIKSYFDVVLGEKTAALAEESVKLTQEHVARVERYHEEDMATDFDLSTARVKLNGAKTALLNANNKLRIARLRFLNTLGLKQESEVVLVDRLGYQTLEMAFDEAITVAARKRADLSQARLAIKLSEKSIDLTRGNHLPKIAAFFNYGYEDPSQKKFGESEGDDYWVAGVGLSMPLFDGHSTEGKLMQERSNLRQARLALRDLEQKIGLEIRNALLELEYMQELAATAQEGLRQARERKRLAEVGLENGTETPLDVLEADLEVTRASVAFFQAVYGHTLAKTNLRKAVGLLFESYENRKGEDNEIDH